MRHWVLSLTRDGLSGIAQCTTMHTPSPLHCVITRSALCRGRQPWFPTPASQFFSQCLEEYPVMEQAEHHQLHGQVPKLHCCLCTFVLLASKLFRKVPFHALCRSSSQTTLPHLHFCWFGLPRPCLLLAAYWAYSTRKSSHAQAPCLYSAPCRRTGEYGCT